ncbi:D-alanyl-D-alanine carboxypeptidase/D-alanyl-D-alanine-endopeptidase [Mycetohabitans sp. B8]|uniref:D-alanyl-D-alanine carboxypeptidase/D-alanyl-D-alanine endopeptidase n=1 Tax=Mycetohabitans sp. B8 TaxID=2841845 RepID=UPI001F030E3D|nr:D-alanyl-D-alanine carboxypeptidase/D-alanyl-D-alanine-endopeptidase [Mycetohabitans sp. B8]
MLPHPFAFFGRVPRLGLARLILSAVRSLSRNVDVRQGTACVTTLPRQAGVAAQRSRRQWLAAILACAAWVALPSVPTPAFADAKPQVKGRQAKSKASRNATANASYVKARPKRCKGKTADCAVNVPSGPLPAPVMDGLARARVPPSSVSVVVQRVGDTRPLLAWNARAPMLPASTMKLVTTYAGLSILGPDYRWRTSAYRDGSIDASGVLHGNLYIQGTGDPKLTPEELLDLVDKIHKQGIIAVDGDLILDKRWFDASTRDLPAFDENTNSPYNVGPDPLLYAFKSLSFTLNPSPSGDVAINMTPALAQLKIVNQLRETRGACTSVLHSMTPAIKLTPQGIVQAVFSGDYPTRCGERTVNMAALDHSSFFAGGFLALWKQTGGTFTGTVREGATPPNAHLVVTHRGIELSTIVHDINKLSNNTMARNLFLSIGAVGARPIASHLPVNLAPPVPSTPARSAQVIRDFLAKSGLAMPELKLDNGSGLSRNEHISAASMAKLLVAANASPVAQAFVASLPIAGVDGTMRHRLTGAPVGGNARIKTGTLRNVRAIAGYVAAASGESYVVVSLINDPRAAAARQAHDALLEWVYQRAR